MYLLYVRSEDNLQESILSSYHVGPGDQTQVVGLGFKYLYPMSHLLGTCLDF